jgi:hypothetical protein
LSEVTCGKVALAPEDVDVPKRDLGLRRDLGLAGAKEEVASLLERACGVGRGVRQVKRPAVAEK